MMRFFPWGFALLQASAGGPVLHEYVPTRAGERRAVPVLGEPGPGGLPSEIEEDGQRITPPAAAAPAAPGDRRFVADRDTGTAAPPRPGGEPFSPALGPFARSSALDLVGEDYTLSIADPKLVPLPPAGRPGPDRTFFYGRVEVELRPGVPVAVPSPAPGLRFVGAELRSAGRALGEPVTLLRDGADNLYARAQAGGARTLTYLVDAPKSYFEGLLPPEVSTPDVPRASAPRLPDRARRAAAKVLARIGIAEGETRVASLLGRLVPYFRSFVDAPPPASSRPTGDVYLDLATGQRGVCRHRAFAFVVTAQALGLPARLVLSDVHAFAEVEIPHLGWRRVDLGGARVDLPPGRSARAPGPHARADDPFPQPPSYRAHSGGSIVPEARAEAGRPESGGAGARPVTSATAEVDAPASEGSGAPTDLRAPTELELDAPAILDVRRGEVLDVSGRARVQGADPAGLTIDVYLHATAEARSVWVASAITDAAGRFHARGAIPRATVSGEHQLIVRSRGDERRAPSR